MSSNGTLASGIGPRATELGTRSRAAPSCAQPTARG